MSSISQLKGQILRAPGSQMCTFHEGGPHHLTPKTWGCSPVAVRTQPHMAFIPENFPAPGLSQLT